MFYRLLCVVALLLLIPHAALAKQSADLGTSVVVQSALPVFAEDFQEFATWKSYEVSCVLSHEYTAHTQAFKSETVLLHAHEGTVSVSTFKNVSIFSIGNSRGEVRPYRVQAFHFSILEDGAIVRYSGSIFVKNSSNEWEEFGQRMQESVDAANALDELYLYSLGINPKSIGACKGADES